MLDYKTGSSVKPPETTHRKGEDYQWVDLQLPLYRQLLPRMVDEQGQRLVSSEVVGPGGIRFGYVSLPQTQRRVISCWPTGPRRISPPRRPPLETQSGACGRAGSSSTPP